MAGLTDLLGKHGALEQLLLWGLVNQVLSTASQPALTALLQDVQSRNPDQALDPTVAAEAAARGLLGKGQAAAEAAKGGMDAARFALLSELHAVRLSPAELATAILRSYMTRSEAVSEAKPQGVTPAQLDILTALAGDAPGPQQLAQALRRGLIPEAGSGANAVTFEQGIRESRLHDKWAPLIAELAKVLLSPPDAASAVVRNFMTRADAEALAAKQGIDADTFARLVDLSGDSPGPQQLAEALRRGLIPDAGTGAASVSFQQGIAEGRLADKWAPVIKGLAKLWPTPTDALEAALKGQLTAEQGKATYELLGGDPQFYQWLLNSVGDAPSPLEAASMAARGIIPWHGTGPDVTSFDQAIREGRLRNKWTDSVRQMTKYLPPPGEIITFLAHNAITKDRATQMLSEHYMDDDVMAAFMSEAEETQLSDYRGLTQSSVVDMYYAHLINADQATAILTALHVTPQAAELLLSYADLRQLIDSITKSVQRIATLFTSRKIGTDTATQALTRLGIPAASVDAIVQTWEIQAAANVKTLTQSEIVNAWYYQILDQQTAIDELGAIGYTPYDSWVLLSLKAKGPLPGQPEKIVAPPQGAVIPGVT